jgi:ABC-2 type transport system ATP-binding protein
MFAFELEAVSKRYGVRAALADVSLSLTAGSALGLLGPNGAGKTTALRLLLGFARPTRGRVRLRGLSPGNPASRRGVAYLPERLRLPARASVRGFLALHATLAGLDSPGREIDAVLETTGLATRADDRIGDLSKGLAQRVGFAQALLGPPELLLLDEPTSGLDPIGIRDARDWIQALRRRGCTVLVSSHVLSEVERTCDRAAILHQGRVLAEGAVNEIARPGESLEDAFLRLVRA